MRKALRGERQGAGTGGGRPRHRAPRTLTACSSSMASPPPPAEGGSRPSTGAVVGSSGRGGMVKFGVCACVRKEKEKVSHRARKTFLLSFFFSLHLLMLLRPPRPVGSAAGCRPRGRARAASPLTARAAEGKVIKEERRRGGEGGTDGDEGDARAQEEEKRPSPTLDLPLPALTPAPTPSPARPFPLCPFSSGTPPPLPSTPPNGPTACAPPLTPPTPTATASSTGRAWPPCWRRRRAGWNAPCPAPPTRPPGPPRPAPCPPHVAGCPRLTWMASSPSTTPTGMGPSTSTSTPASPRTVSSSRARSPNMRPPLRPWTRAATAASAPPSWPT